MKYCSTRGKAKDISFEEALFSGYASDGGLYLPESIPQVSEEFLKEWAKLTYPEIVKRIMALYISQEELPTQDLDCLVDEAYSHFPVPEVVRVTPLRDGLNVAELYHGVTLAFKDLALAVVGQLFGYFLNKQQQNVIIVVGTSGDTGSSALEAVRGLGLIDIIVLFPKGKCTRIQELQMTTVIEDNVHLYAVEGTSDSLDVPVKDCFLDAAFAQKHHLCSINSINWGRILVQIAHHFFIYFRVCEEVGRKVQIVVPTGAGGNITAGCIATKMGLPIELAACVNHNNIVHRSVSEGDFTTRRDVTPSWALAMDIQVPYNMERLLFLFSDGNARLVAELMQSFETKNGVEIPPEILGSMKAVITGSCSVSDAAILETIQRCWKENHYLLCPHTAVGVAYHYQTRENKYQHLQACIATAAPAKFPEAVSSAGLVPELSGQLTQLLERRTRYRWMRAGENWTEILRRKIEDITEMRTGRSCSHDEGETK